MTDTFSQNLARAQAHYDRQMPPDAPIFRCEESGEMNEDCDLHNGECPEPDDGDVEPPDFDEWRANGGRDAWMDDPRDDYDF